MTDPSARPRRIVLLGPPASGKGTQGRRLAETLGVSYLSTGAVLRENVENSTPLGKQAKPILDRGEYLPDELMCPLIVDWLERQSDGWVLDGFPRSLPQARFLDRWLADRDETLDAAVALEVPYDQLLFRIRNRVECPDCRWTGQKEQAVDGRCPVCSAAVGPRPDDSEENFNSRFREFERLTLPVIEHYRAVHLLRPCDATASKDEVAERLYGRLARQNQS